MIIEFVGLPGSGKSVMCKEIRKVLRRKRLFVWTRQEFWSNLKEMNKLFVTFYVYFSLAVTFIKYFSFIVFNLSLRDILSDFSLRYKLYIFTNFLTTLWESELARKVDANGFVLMDEGVIQRAYTIFVHLGKPAHRKEILVYALKARMPDVAIYLKINDRLALQRIQSRGLPLRMEALTEDEKRTMLRDGKNFLDQFISIIEKRRECIIFEVGAECIDSAKEEIVEFILQKMLR